MPPNYGMRILSRDVPNPASAIGESIKDRPISDLAVDDLAVDDLAGSMKALLRQSIGFQSTSGNEGPFTHFLADWAKKQGFDVDLWQAKESDVAKIAPLPRRHLPLANRPTLVIRLPGRDPLGRSLIFNAHSDVVSAPNPDLWKTHPWSGQEHNGIVYGRGTCDTKGPLVSALWALLEIRSKYTNGLAGDIIVEIIPGEEDCVGLGTLTSIARGYTADAAIILEPTEGLPRNASRGGCRFEVVAKGASVHGTVKWLGKDAISLMRLVLNELDSIEKQWNDRDADGLFSSYPIMRPITVDHVHGGDWQGMVCDRCICAGYLELLPRDNPAEWACKLERELMDRMRNLGRIDTEVEVRTSEQYDGHNTAANSSVCRVAEEVMAARSIPQWVGWQAFNSGCESGVRHGILSSPTLIWGPGSLAQAHAPDEFVKFDEVRSVAALLADFAVKWSGFSKDA